jgi:hypothetical protein
VLIGWLLSSVAVPSNTLKPCWINDSPCRVSTSGTRINGTFANGGFQITGQYDSIYWHLPYPVYKGTAEFYVKGVNPNEC